MIRLRSPIVAFIVALGATAGCLSVPSTDSTATCGSNADCDDSAGEVCSSSGVCTGNPPVGTFAATVGAPSTKPDLMPVELPTFALPSDGQLGPIALGTAVNVTGRVELADHTSVDAAITISRPSRFPGGPGFHTVVSSAAGVTGESFSARVPLTGAADPLYTLIVVPNGRGPTPTGASMAAQTVPPLYTTLAFSGDTTIATMLLGDPSQTMLTGTVTDSQGTPLPHYRVSVTGRWDPTAAPTEVSTVSYTGSDGAYSVVLSSGLTPSVTLVAVPYDTTAPTLTLSGFNVGSSGAHKLVQPAALGAPINLVIPVEGADSGGTVSPVVGARVAVIGTTSSNQLGELQTATLISEDITDADGNAHLTLLPGGALAASYVVRIVPPAGSNLGVIYNQVITAATSGTTTPYRLQSRISVRGSVIDSTGHPVANVSVTAQPSLRFLWNLPDDPQAFVAAIPPATTVTTATGDFQLFVDPLIAGVFGYYDLAFQPAAGSTVPDFTQTELEVPRDDTGTDIEDYNVMIPAPAVLQGEIVDPAGAPVPGGLLQIFEIPDAGDLCTTASNAPVTSCALPAVISGTGTADDTGAVELDVPRS